MAGVHRGIRLVLAAAAVSFLSPLAQSAQVVTGYWSDVNKNESTVKAFLSPKASQNSSESRLLKLDLVELRDALKLDRWSTLCCPTHTAVLWNLPCGPRRSCQSNWRRGIRRFAPLRGRAP